MPLIAPLRAPCRAPPMNFSNPSFWLDAAQTLVIVLLWLRKPGEDAKTNMAALGGRVDVFEERMKHMPTSDELTEVEGTVRAMHAKLEGMADAVKTTRNGVQRIEDFLRVHR